MFVIWAFASAEAHRHSAHEPHPPRWTCATIGSFPDLNCFARCFYRDGTREVLPVVGENIPIVGRNYLCEGSDVRNNCGDRICKTPEECAAMGFPYDPCHNVEKPVCMERAQAETGLMCVDTTPIVPPEPVVPTTEPAGMFPATWACDSPSGTDGLSCRAACVYYDGSREFRGFWGCPTGGIAGDAETKQRVCRARAVRETQFECSVRADPYTAVRSGEDCVLRVVKNFERNRAELWQSCWNPPDDAFLPK